MNRTRPAVAALVRDLEQQRRPLTRRELVDHFCERTLTRAVASGGVTIMAPGIYAASTVAPEFDIRMRTIRMWSGETVVPAGGAALRATGAINHAPSTILLLAPPTFGKKSIPGTRIIRTIATVATMDSPYGRVSSTFEAVTQVWCENTPHRRIGATLDALRITHPPLALVRDAAVRWPRMPDRAGLLTLIDLYSTGVTSVLEYLGRTRVFSGRDFADWTWQAPITVAGHTYVVDLFHQDSRTAIELDGAAWHRGDEYRRRDIERDALLASVGVLTVRMTYEDITQRPWWCRRQALAAVAQRMNQ